MLLKNAFILFLLLGYSSLVIAQEAYKAKYHWSDGLMGGATIRFKKDGTFSKESASCMVSSSAAGKYKIESDTLNLLYNIEENFAKKYKLKFNSDLINRDSLKIKIDLGFDSSTNEYCGIEFSFYDTNDSIINTLLVKAKSKGFLIVSCRNDLRYRARFIRKTEKKEIANLKDDELSSSDLIDPMELGSSPLFEKFFIAHHTKQEIVLEGKAVDGSKYEMKYVR